MTKSKLIASSLLAAVVCFASVKLYAQHRKAQQMAEDNHTILYGNWEVEKEPALREILDEVALTPVCNGVVFENTDTSGSRIVYNPWTVHVIHFDAYTSYAMGYTYGAMLLRSSNTNHPPHLSADTTAELTEKVCQVVNNQGAEVR